ncbi:sensor domain-containing diguanylate cyclase [Aurantimonas coralicida]|uniref:sensor domain-containing diguanylate cyclase n=1 Tax=Aurantimonas coralicida TaxID=182270 RepID=UPI002E7B60E3|nr:diguanylate cyclase [Aurantimonas coralicida]MCD1645643.1 diguanylate cyclase [Aurantimonas coralicida]|tara:strand:+ start:225 stop:1211 length:987 start_codon:yes stop_codon:yes gene_type:complete
MVWNLDLELLPKLLDNHRDEGVSQARADEEVLASFSRLIENSAVLIAVYDPDDRLRYANSASREALFIDPDDLSTWEGMMRRNYAARRGTIIETDDIEAWLASAMSRRGKLPTRSFESDLHDGRWLWITETVAPNNWSLFVGTDVTDLGTAGRKLRTDRDVAIKASHTDELTGISNRRHIMLMLESLIARQPSAQQSVGCACLVDIDHFKLINDTFGHQAGDQVLVEFAQAVRGAIRLRDGFGRVGGEEFLLIMPATSLPQGETVLDRVFDTVRHLAPIPASPNHAVTFSGGLTEIRLADTAETVYSRCDAALYAAKSGGRDRLITRV